MSQTEGSMQGSCQCGVASFTCPPGAPLRVYHCHCLECRKQSGSAFGTSVIFPYFEIPENPNISSFDRSTDSGKVMRCYFCNKCGTRLLHAHHRDAKGELPRGVAVKGGVIDGLTKGHWKGAEHIFCRTALVEIPEGVKRFDGEPKY